MTLHSDTNGEPPLNRPAKRPEPGGLDSRRLFLQHVAQTSPAPLGLEIVRADGIHLYDPSGKEYIDLIGGISVCNTGHRHPRVVEAIKDQADRYLHLLVYGELIQSPQVQYAALLAANLPASLDSIYFTNSGTEATEGAMKLAKRVTGRVGIVAFKQSYHGSTQGALSIMGDEYWRNAYRPLLPGVAHEEYNSFDALESITGQTACVIAETVQAERGVYTPEKDWLKALRKRCDDKGALLVLDEIQVGFGRTGTLWGFQQYGVVPDILLLGKALGGGMPMGAFIAGRELMWTLTGDPVLGHITTFGGHPVCCAAGLASLRVLLEEDWIGQVTRKGALFHQLLSHTSIKAVRSSGLLMAVEFESFEKNKQVIDACIEKGLLTDWYLFAPQCMRIAPPLIISEEQIRKACSIILSCL
jgi:acetylornithine/N-succinyldiaminopimelate aminotransferase